MKKVLVTLFLFIVGVLPIFFASSYAADDLADDCFSVKELIANSDTKDALNRIVKPLRMHVQDFQDAGINYEGQLDIACLIGIYMTRDLGGDGDEALARFTALTEVMKGNMDNHVLSMKDLWQYKESNELTDRERREGYSDSEFFILVWADMPQKVPKSMRIEGYPYESITNPVWCDAIAKERVNLDDHRSKIANAPLTNKTWPLLSEDGYKQAAIRWKRFEGKYQFICASNRLIAEADIRRVRKTYIDKAQDITTNYWRKFVNSGEDSNRPWKELSWLKPSCARAPTNNEVRVIKRAIHAKAGDDLSWWNKEARQAWKESKGLQGTLREVGDQACHRNLQKEIAALGNGIAQARSAHETAINRDIGKYWEDLKRGEINKIEKQLKANHEHVYQATSIREQCLTVSNEVKDLISEANILKREVSFDDKSINAFDRTSLGRQDPLRRLTIDCEGTKASQFASSLLSTIEKRRKVYTNTAEKEAAKSWLNFYESGKYKSRWAHVNFICGSCAPMPGDEKIVATLKDKKAINFSDVDRGEMQIFREKIQLLNSQTQNLQPILRATTQYLSLWDKVIGKRWTDSLKGCQPIDRSVAVFNKINQFCSLPTVTEETYLLDYCRLKQLVKDIPGAKREKKLRRSSDGSKVEGEVCVGRNEYAVVGEKDFDGVWTFTGDGQNEPLCKAGSSRQVTSGQEYAVKPGAQELYDVIGFYQASEQVKKAGFKDVKTYRTALENFQRNRIPELVVSRLGHCKPSVRSIKNADIARTWNTYYDSFSSLLSSLGEDSVELKQDIGDILQKLTEDVVGGYVDEEKVLPKSAEPKPVTPKKEAKTVHIEITSNVDNAEIYFDGKFIGMTRSGGRKWARTWLVGDVTIEVRKAGYVPYKEIIKLKDSLSLDVVLKEKIDARSIATPESTLPEAAPPQESECQLVVFDEGLRGGGKFYFQWPRPTLQAIGQDKDGHKFANFCSRDKCEPTPFRAGDSFENYVVLWIDLKTLAVALIDQNLLQMFLSPNDGSAQGRFGFIGDSTPQPCKVVKTQY